MVKSCLYLLCLCWITLLEAIPSVDASIDSMNSQAHFPLQGTLTITHSQEEIIDPQSFQMEGKPLETSFVKEVKISASSDLLLTIYSFQLPAQEKGRYILPSLTVKVGNQTYHTAPSTYEVQGETASQSLNLSSPVIFRLEAGVKGVTTLYPGQHTKLMYRISYNKSIDLTRSEFPMIHPSHFQKVGDVQIRDYQQQNLTIQDLTQEVEASEIGTFQLGPSFIEGYAYEMKADQKVYDPHLLKSEAPVVTLEVKPFPQSEQPLSFTGALGQIKIETSLKSSSSVAVGDIFQLQIKVQGISNLIDLRLPSLECQPGFSGFFQTSDLPPLAEIKENTKVFDVELRPLTSLISQIPSIEVSSFDPLSQKYMVQRSPPIPLSVHSPVKENISIDSVPILTQHPPKQWPTPFLSPLKLENFSILIQEQKSSWIQTAGVLWMLPLGLSFLLLQYYLYKQWKKRPKPQLPKSEELLQCALKTPALTLTHLHVLEQAFWHRLWEKGIIPQGTFQLEKLPREKNIEKMHSFIFQLQALQYSLDKAFDPQQLKQQAKMLFEKI